ncbi:hypothetical protein HPB49_014309 [Dermacentor silvarum]|uniref:Uncharacterized protein n=1 Tax=Dermacentor silvarum TaxID=543639 RepID=A0ACB8DDT7_DERSI|nr:hypothetical protein HPB49_014309 [Dermacentor silvarum]
MANNYLLVRVSLSGVLTKEAARHCFIVRDVMRRNCALVARAAQFARGRALDRRVHMHCAVALERVWRHAGLLEELAEQQCLSVAEAYATVRRGLRSIESLHDFMRFTRVVQDYVVCRPRQDGRPQLDTLHEDCWRMIRRYLMTDDVKEPVESAPVSH